MNDKVFDRIEKKYLITKDQKKAFLPLIKKRMKKDSYYSSKVVSIYFDNDNYDLITQSIDWTDFKEKLRARSYEGYDRVFIEIKTKIRCPEDNVGYKRRVMITRSDFDKLVSHENTLAELSQASVETENDLQIAKEADYLIEHFGLNPKIAISYDRKSYKDDQGLRITFDENLKYRNKNLSFIKAKRDKIYFKNDHNIIMEVKAQGAMPLWLVQKMSELKVYPQQFSKIGKIYERITKEQNV